MRKFVIFILISLATYSCKQDEFTFINKENESWELIKVNSVLK